MCVRSPDRPEAPRLWLGATAGGNVVRLRYDVKEHFALAGCLALAGSDAIERELTYVADLPGHRASDVPVVASGTPEGHELLARLAAIGMPAGLAEMGFRGVGDLWSPWCAAVRGGTVVAVAFAARISALGAEAGVATAPEARACGLGTAVTSAWLVHPELAGRVLFYTTAADNHASRRIAERLGLRLLGPTISIY